MRTPLLCCALLYLLASSVAAQTRESLLVTADWLAAHLDDPQLVLLHVGPRDAYATEHIRGARFVDLREIAPNADGLTLQMPSTEELREKLSRLGISNDSRVVVSFANGSISAATRLMLTLDYAGLENARLLDGGLAAWKEQNRPLTDQVPAQRTGTLTTLNVKPLIVTAEQVQAAIGKAGTVVVDARTTAFYDGVSPGGGAERPHKTGHVAGARSVPYLTLYTSSGTLKPAEELEQVFADAGVKRDDTVIGYCHIGQQATAMLFAARALGHKVLLYDGSFEDWSRRDLPVEASVRK